MLWEQHWRFLAERLTNTARQACSINCIPTLSSLGPFSTHFKCSESLYKRTLRAPDLSSLKLLRHLLRAFRIALQANATSSRLSITHVVSSWARCLDLQRSCFSAPYENDTRIQSLPLKNRDYFLLIALREVIVTTPERHGYLRLLYWSQTSSSFRCVTHWAIPIVYVFLF